MHCSVKAYLAAQHKLGEGSCLWQKQSCWNNSSDHKQPRTTHPFIYHCPTLGERQATPRTGFWFIRGLTYSEQQPHTQTHIHTFRLKDNVESLINLPCMCLTGNHTDTGRTRMQTFLLLDNSADHCASILLAKSYMLNYNVDHIRSCQIVWMWCISSLLVHFVCTYCTACQHDFSACCIYSLCTCFDNIVMDNMPSMEHPDVALKLINHLAHCL